MWMFGRRACTYRRRSRAAGRPAPRSRSRDESPNAHQSTRAHGGEATAVDLAIVTVAGWRAGWSRASLALSWATTGESPRMVRSGRGDRPASGVRPGPGRASSAQAPAGARPWAWRAAGGGRSDASSPGQPRPLPGVAHPGRQRRVEGLPALFLALGLARAPDRASDLAGRLTRHARPPSRRRPHRPTRSACRRRRTGSAAAPRGRARAGWPPRRHATGR